MNENEIYCKCAEDIEAAKRASEGYTVESLSFADPVMVSTVVFSLAIVLSLCVLDRFYWRAKSHDIVEINVKSHDANDAVSGGEARNYNNNGGGFTDDCFCVANEWCCANKQGVGGEQ